MSNSALDLRVCSSWKMSLMTLGMIPSSSSLTPRVKPDPIVYVLPEPVCPYASTVALNPQKQPSTRFFTHTSNTCYYERCRSKHLSNVKQRPSPIMTSSWETVTQILEFSQSSLGTSGLTLRATRTEQAPC